MLCYGGFLGQGLAVVMLLFVVNWSTVTLFFMKPEKSKTPEPAAKEGEAADAQKAAPSSDADRQAGGSGQ